MEIKVEIKEGRVPVTVFHLSGDLNHEEPLQSRVKEAYESGARNVLLDLQEVPYISSAGLRVLHTVYNLLNKDQLAASQKEVRRGIASGSYKSPNLKLLRPSKNAMKALSIAGYDMFLDIYDKQKEAVAAF
jgi:anti-anti-sigma factor